MKTGQKHLIECNCILPQFRNMPKPLFHKFVVFSIIDENDTVVPKFAQCPNCHIVHYVSEIGTSEITTKENISAIKTKDDISLCLPKHILGILEAHHCDLATYEEIEFLLDNEMWDSKVLISKDTSEDKTLIKSMILKKGGMIKIETFSRDEYI